jgi:hypothetical protein
MRALHGSREHLQLRPEMRRWQDAHHRVRSFDSIWRMIDPRRTINNPAAIVVAKRIEPWTSVATISAIPSLTYWSAATAAQRKAATRVVMLGNPRVRRPGRRGSFAGPPRDPGALASAWQSVRRGERCGRVRRWSSEPATPRRTLRRAHTLRSCAEGTGPATRRGVVRWSEPDAREGFEVVGRVHGLSSTVKRRSRSSDTTLAPGNGLETSFSSGQAPRQPCASPSRGGSAQRSEHAVQRCRRGGLESGAPTTPLGARAPVTGELQLSALSPRAAPTVIGLGTLRLLQRCSRRVPFQGIAAHAHVMPNNGTTV